MTCLFCPYPFQHRDFLQKKWTKTEKRIPISAWQFVMPQFDLPGIGESRQNRDSQL